MQLNQKSLAALLGLSTRQIRRLTDDGMPSVAGPRHRSYGPAAIAWYIEQKVKEERERHDRTEREQLEIERLVHQNREAKVRADLAEEKVVLVSEAAEEWADAAATIRATLLRASVQYADQVRPDDPASGEEALEFVMNDILGTLRERLAGPELLVDEAGS